MFGLNPSPTSPDPHGKPEPTGYERHKQRMAERQRKESAAARDIAPTMPEVADPKRRARALKDFKFFCRAYFAKVFYLDFSKDHLRVIEKAERAVLEGGQFAMAMPRGSGKTAICSALCLWAILIGKHEVVMLIGATKTAAIELLDGIKSKLIDEKSPFAKDFPEVCYPIERLEGIHQRRLLFNGKPIKQEWKKESLVLPSLPPNPAASANIVVRGLTGRIRGYKFARPDGRDVRPSLVIIDDPQTRKSAKSLAQNNERESIINGDVLGLAGPDVPIAALMPCTVIHPDDMADRLLDPERNPEWQGERMRLVYKWPEGQKADALWEEYGVLRKQALRDGRPPTKADALYRKNRKVMDGGSKVAWPERKYPGTLSAIQHAMNLVLKLGKAGFNAEYQNEPIRAKLDEEIRLDADTIAAKVNGHTRGIVPITAAHLVAMIDVQETALFYAVVAWGAGFTGDVVDYGTYPDQKRLYFEKSDIKRTYRDELPGQALEAQLYQALRNLTTDLLGRQWKREGGISTTSIALCHIDYGHKADVVFQFCRESPFRNILMPSKGKGIGAAGTPLNEYKGQKDDVVGESYRIGTLQTAKRAIPSVLFETNHWKSFAEQRLNTPQGARGALSLFGDSPLYHRMFADHMASEYHTRVKALKTGRTVDEWKETPGRDNDLFDCIVGCCVAGHRAGARLLEDAAPRNERPELDVSF